MLAFVLFSLLSSTAYSQVITPPRPVGFNYKNGNPNAKVHVEIFIDLICPDSREAWPHIKEMADFYGPNNVRLTVHLFPLPYHQNGFYAARGAFVTHYLSNGTRTFDWIDKVLIDNINDLRDSVFHEKSDADLLEHFSIYAEELGLNVTAFLELVDRRNPNTIEWYTRVMWKHACSNGIYTTPSYMVNGIFQPAILQSWDLAQWQAYIDPLLAPGIFDEIDGTAQGPPVSTD